MAWQLMVMRLEAMALYREPLIVMPGNGDEQYRLATGSIAMARWREVRLCIASGGR